MSRVLSVVACLTLPALAHAQSPRVIAISGQPALGQPATNTYSQLYAITLSPTGDVAFASTGNSPNQSLQQGLYAQRAGVLTRIADNTTLGTLQSLLLPLAMKTSGDVFFSGSELVPPAPAAFFARLAAADGSSVDLMRRGWVVPGVPEQVFTSTVESAAVASRRRVITDDRNLLLYLASVPADTPNSPQSAGLFRYTPETGLTLEAFSQTLQDPDIPTFTILDWPEDINNSGQAIVKLTPPGASAAYYLLSGSTPTRLLGVLDLIPGGPANLRVVELRSALINDAGRVFVNVVDESGFTHFIAGQPGNLQLIHSTGQIISSPRESALPFFSSGGAPAAAALAEDGTAIIFCTNTTYTPPAGGGTDCSILAIAPDGTKRLLWNQREPVRMLDGVAVRVHIEPRNAIAFSSPRSGRIAWICTPLRPPFRSAVCTLDDAGDPVTVLEGLTPISTPIGSFTLANSLVSNLTTFWEYSRDINDRGDIALIASAVNAQGAARSVAVVASLAPSPCGDIDFNNNAVFPEDQDVIDFFNVLAGAPCPTLRCDTLDFNRNGSFPEDQDVIDFLTVLAGGSCS
ncbi:MAG TPA: hypothetical protein VK157_09090 [Phycisphaerales bacterium]|nr:hypothetical protein [Phycisphaerales bacterium]